MISYYTDSWVWSVIISLAFALPNNSCKPYNSSGIDVTG